MKKTLNPLGASAILVLTSGIVFPIIFTVTDKFLRTLLTDINPISIITLSFLWLLLFYFLGIKFTMEYLEREFTLLEPRKLLHISLTGFTLINLFFYASLFSASLLSNVLWGTFYLITIGMFYYLGIKTLDQG